LTGKRGRDRQEGVLYRREVIRMNEREGGKRREEYREGKGTRKD